MESDNIDDKSPCRNLPLSQRVVHFDLKGAPPKIDYLMKMIPLLRQWGATGILIEYEDMFPYRNRLSLLSKPHAYTSDDIRSLQEVTKAEGMDFIPLLQSFGHVEFILKHSEYKHLREATVNPMSLCPTHKQSLPLIEEIVDQYIEEHNDLKYLHIGGDEVFCIGICKDCLDTQQSIPKLYLSHMMPLITSIKRKYPTLKLFIWDDMFREFSLSELEMLGPSVIPMVWSYVDYISTQFPDGMWERYGNVFEEIWIASSFKGSSGPLADVVPIQHHLNNHLSWFSLVESLEEDIRKKIIGITITGWSRYDHFATLCEIFPIGIPCLALCLQVSKLGDFSKSIHNNVSKALGFVSLIPIQTFSSPDISCGNFPGSELIWYVTQMETAKKQVLMSIERMDGWMDLWHTEVTKDINLGHIEYICSLLRQSIQTYESIRAPLLECLSFHFHEETVREFVKTKIEGKLKQALELLSKAQNVKNQYMES